MKISTEGIEGFAEMTAEQKLEAVLSMEVPDEVDLSGYVKKSVFDDKAKEAAEYSRQLKEKKTDEENARDEAAEAHAKLLKDYNDLLKKSTIAEYTAKYLAAGYDEKLAADTATALFDGDMEKVFANQQTFNAGMEKRIRADLIKQDPRPTGTDSVEPKMDKNIELATKLGKAKAESLNQSQSVIENYI